MREAGIIAPFPQSRPKLDSNYKLAFSKPAGMNVVGSFALGTLIKNQEEICVDFVITMPQSMFQEKDYLNYRYFLKRTYYISCIAAAIKAKYEARFQIQFNFLNGNYLLPVIILQPVDTKNSITPWRIQIILAIQRGTFSEDRLLPVRNSIRMEQTGGDPEKQPKKPTPFYNASILVDSMVTSYLKLYHDTLKSCDPFLDACLLGRIWLQQRGFGSQIEKGGFGSFEWSMMIALLLRGGGSKKIPLFSEGYSSYQFFKALLQLIASRDLVKDPIVINGSSTLQIPRNSDIPYLFDGERSHNILYKMTTWSYRLLQHEAQVSLDALNDSGFDQFEPTFISKSDHYLCKYDGIIEIPLTAFLKDQKGKDSTMDLTYQCQDLYRTLARAMNTRARLISLHVPTHGPWDIGKAPMIAGSDQNNIIVGFLFDEAQIYRTVDRGPSAENAKEAASFHRFWGDKAELRRFKDGSIVESVIWSGSASTIFQNIVSFALLKHIGSEVGQNVRFIEDSTKKYLASRTNKNQPDKEIFQAAAMSLRELEREIRNLDDMPLHLRQLLPADSQLSYSSIGVPFVLESERPFRVANATIQFEGSARWPDDMDAIQRTKVAFFLKLADLLEQSNNAVTCRTGLENEGEYMLNQAFLDVIYSSGATYRLRIHHDREATLLEKLLKDKTKTPQEKTDAASALHAYKQMFVLQPTHTLAIQSLSTRHPSFSSTVRLVKCWFSSHLLSNHFHNSLIELFAARVYTQPYPWATPCSALSGLLRTLILLSNWDWQDEPWIANLGPTSMAETAISAIQTRFKAWRKIDPGLNRVVLFAASSVDGDGATWTDHAKPLKVVACRMTALARAAVQMIKDHGTALDLDSLFASSLSDYDFTIHINRDAAAGVHGRSDKKKFKNLQLQNAADVESIEYDQVQQLMSELESTFGEAVVFFHDAERRDTIAGLWNPQTQRVWKLKLGYSSIPIGKKDDIDVNKDGMLNEIARLGGDLIKSIKIRGNE
jgi:U3 small nucleolar RNA-associated protein 22